MPQADRMVSVFSVCSVCACLQVITGLFRRCRRGPAIPPALPVTIPESLTSTPHASGGQLSLVVNPLKGVSTLAVERLTVANKSETGGRGPTTLPLSARQENRFVPPLGQKVAHAGSTQSSIIKGAPTGCKPGQKQSHDL